MHVVSSTGGFLTQLVDTREVYVALEEFALFTVYVLARLAITPFRRQAKVSEFDTHILEQILIRALDSWNFVINSNENIIWFQIIIDLSTIVYELKNIHELKTQSKNASIAQLIILTLQNLMKICSISWHEIIYQGYVIFVRNSIFIQLFFER